MVIDEAHHCIALSGGDREDSQRRRLADMLARHCDALLLLTATPHDGNDRSFASLYELLDPSLVDHNGELRGDRYRSHVVRRLKRHIIDPRTGAQRFRERVVLPSPVAAEPDRCKPDHFAHASRLADISAATDVVMRISIALIKLAMSANAILSGQKSVALEALNKALVQARIDWGTTD
jgi:hypothetical protein